MSKGKATHLAFKRLNVYRPSAMVRSTFLLLFAALCAPLAMALEKGQAEGAHSLTSDNFKAKTGKGLW